MRQLPKSPHTTPSFSEDDITSPVRLHRIVGGESVSRAFSHGATFPHNLTFSGIWKMPRRNSLALHAKPRSDMFLLDIENHTFFTFESIVLLTCSCKCLVGRKVSVLKKMHSKVIRKIRVKENKNVWPFNNISTWKTSVFLSAFSTLFGIKYLCDY